MLRQLIQTPAARVKAEDSHDRFNQFPMLSTVPHEASCGVHTDAAGDHQRSAVFKSARDARAVAARR